MRRGLAFLAAIAALPCAALAQDRVASVGGDVTEVVFLLGQQDRLVARDTTSIYPPEALELPDLGYMRALSAEGVLAMQPDLVLLNAGSGPPEAVEALNAAGVAVATIPDAPTVGGVGERITAVAEALGVPEAGATLRATVEADMTAAIAAADPGDAPRPTVLFVLSNTGGRLMGAGEGTAAEAIIRMAGAENAVGGFTGYKALGDEAVAVAAPDIVLTMHTGSIRDELAGPPDEYIKHPALTETPAGKAGRVISVPGQLMLGFGPRTAEAITTLHEAIVQAMADAPAGQ